ncbi:MAG: hypothetical protein SWK90_04925 [Chloroflexota bacterium]|nr:hypothetical protein [Chloroflexota bacterium]
MPADVVFTGLACGTLLAAAGLALWGVFQQVPGLPHTVRVVGWLAGTLLLIGALFGYQGDRNVPAPALRLILIAALATPPGIRRHRLSPWGNVMLVLPALILAWAGLLQISKPITGEPGSTPVLAVELAVVVCGGLGAQALNETLSAIADQTPHSERLTTTIYVLLTLLVSGAALVNLWQQGTIWGGNTHENGLAGAWLAWSAAWIGPRQHPRLRAGVTAMAALLLILMALAYH